MNLRVLLLIISTSCNHCFAQQPRYTPKTFVNRLDTAEFKYIVSKKDGFNRTFLLTRATYFDLDDDSTTYMRFTDSVLIWIEGRVKNGNRVGVYTFHLVDRMDHSKKYKIWEQTFGNDKLDGQWRTYNLRGGLVSSDTYKNGSLNGISKNYWIDGKFLIEETEYLEDQSTYITKKYYENKKLKSESSFKNKKLNGVSKKYYENGNIQEYAEFKDDYFDGTRKYFYENGQLWIEQTYKDGKFLDIVANYTEKGSKRNPGNLKSGTGTIIYYSEDGSVRETLHIINGSVSK